MVGYAAFFKGFHESTFALLCLRTPEGPPVSHLVRTPVPLGGGGSGGPPTGIFFPSVLRAGVEMSWFFGADFAPQKLPKMGVFLAGFGGHFFSGVLWLSLGKNSPLPVGGPLGFPLAK